MNVSRRYLFVGLGVLALAAALAIPVFAQPRWSGAGGRWGMMSGPTPAASGAVTIDTAVTRVKELLTGSSYSDLVPVEVMEFSNHFYVLVKEKNTGIGAMELIVERNGLVHPEPGPNMMWNTKYGHMSGFGGMMGSGMTGGPGPRGGWGRGMMGRGWGQPGQGAAPAQAITIDRARQIASQYLNTAFPGATPDEGTAFYGYFTFDVERSAKTIGMLSVNAYTRQVWYHTWHGTFVQEKDL